MCLQRERFIAFRWARTRLVCWWGKGSPRRRWVAGLRGWSATLGLRHCPDSYGRLQSRIIRNGRKSDGATPREGRRPSGCKLLSRVKKSVWVTPYGWRNRKEAMANSVPAAAVIRRPRALLGFTGRKGCVGGHVCQVWNPGAQPRNCAWNYATWVSERVVEFRV